MNDDNDNLYTIGTTMSDGTFTITTDTTTLTDPEFTINIGDYTTDTIDIDSLSWDFGNKIDPDRVERMCLKYPALDKAWNNFKSIYELVNQDYKGNYEDDDIPF